MKSIIRNGIGKTFQDFCQTHLHFSTAFHVFVSSVTYTLPIVALFWGSLDGEQMSAFQLIGACSGFKAHTSFNADNGIAHMNVSSSSIRLISMWFWVHLYLKVRQHCSCCFAQRLGCSGNGRVQSTFYAFGNHFKTKAVSVLWQRIDQFNITIGIKWCAQTQFLADFTKYLLLPS